MTVGRNGGFTVGSEEMLLEWAMFRLLRRHVTSPTGETFVRTFVETPGAVATVAFTDDRAIVLVHQYRATLDSFVLEIPAGMRDVDGEDPVETARRELREEAGFDAETLTHLGDFLSTPGVTNSALHIYLATDLRRCAVEPHGPEEVQMTIHEVAAPEALAMVRDGRITDGKSCYGILMAHLVRPDLFG